MQSNAKLEEHEQELAQLKLENKTLQRSNTSLQRKVDEVSTQSASFESENLKFAKLLKTLRTPHVVLKLWKKKSMSWNLLKVRTKLCLKKIELVYAEYLLAVFYKYLVRPILLFIKSLRFYLID